MAGFSEKDISELLDPNSSIGELKDIARRAITNFTKGEGIKLPDKLSQLNEDELAQMYQTAKEKPQDISSLL